MSEHEYGNRITSNAKSADDGKKIIEQALKFVKEKHGFWPIDEVTLFTGIY